MGQILHAGYAIQIVTNSQRWHTTLKARRGNGAVIEDIHGKLVIKCAVNPELFAIADPI